MIMLSSGGIMSCICDYDFEQNDIDGRHVRCNEGQVCPEHDKCEDCGDETAATRVYRWPTGGYSKLCAGHYEEWMREDELCREVAIGDEPDSLRTLCLSEANFR